MQLSRHRLAVFLAALSHALSASPLSVQAVGPTEEVVSRPGEFLFFPAGVQHDATNLSATEPARAVVARNDPAE